MLHCSIGHGVLTELLACSMRALIRKPNPVREAVAAASGRYEPPDTGARSRGVGQLGDRIDEPVGSPYTSSIAHGRYRDGPATMRLDRLTRLPEAELAAKARTGQERLIATEPAPAGRDDRAAALVPLRNHPLRHRLNKELHARPFVTVSPPAQMSHLALHTGEEGAAHDHACLVELCERYAVAPPLAGVTHFSHDFGRFWLKWERHTEFVTYTFLRRGGFDEPYRSPVIALVAHDWLDQLPGDVLVATHVAILPRELPPSTEDLGLHLSAETLSGSVVSGGAAAAYTDFRIHADGFGRILLHDRSLGGRQAGRLVQRMLEIQTYQVMALLALPLAREIAPEIARCERELGSSTAALVAADGIPDERGLLDRLTSLAASIERLCAATSYRFRATDAYAALVQRRLEEIREDRIPGLQTLAEFMARRFLPAIRTCSATAERLDSISQRVTRSSELLHTRIGITVQEQNRGLLESVDQRAGLQVRLQEMVEGLSVVAIAYYTLGLLAYAIKALPTVRPGFASDAAIGIASPFVVALVWLLLHRLRNRRSSRQVPTS
jgi:uncharacterized membrane-anchored protein